MFSGTAPLPAMPQHSADRRLAPLAALLIAGIAVLQFGLLSLQSLSNNEFITLGVLDLDYPELIAERMRQNHMPLYFILLKGWTDLTGRSEAMLRLPSAVCAFASILVVWRLGVDWFGRRLGLLTLALCGLNMIQVHMGHNARMYSMLVLAGALALLALGRYLERGGRRWLTLLAAAGLLGITAQLLYLIPLLITAAWLIGQRNAHPVRWRWALLWTLFPLLSVTPLIYWWTQVQYKLSSGQEWNSPLITAALRQSLNIFMGDADVLPRFVRYLHRASAIVALLIVVSLWWRGFRRGLEPQPALAAGRPPIADHRRYLSLWLLLWIIPTVAIGLATMRERSNMVGNWRYYVTFAPVAPLILTSAVQQLRARCSPRHAAAAAACMLFVIAYGTGASLAEAGQGVREAAAHLRTHLRPEDAVLVAEKKTRSLGLVYYGALDQVPPQMVKRIDKQGEILAWIERKIEDKQRMWIVYYKDPDESPVHRALNRNDEYFERLEDEEFRYGGTRLELYRIKPEFHAFNAPAEEAENQRQADVEEQEDDGD